jgi:hypothetical protein
VAELEGNASRQRRLGRAGVRVCDDLDPEEEPATAYEILPAGGVVEVLTMPGGHMDRVVGVQDELPFLTCRYVHPGTHISTKDSQPAISPYPGKAFVQPPAECYAPQTISARQCAIAESRRNLRESHPKRFDFLHMFPICPGVETPVRQQRAGRLHGLVPPAGEVVPEEPAERGQYLHGQPEGLGSGWPGLLRRDSATPPSLWLLPFWALNVAYQYWLY